MSDVKAVLKIGAVFDKEQLEDGLQAGVGVVKASTDAMANSFVSMKSVAEVSFSKLSDGLKQAAAEMEAPSIHLQELLNQQKTAMSDQRLAAQLLRNSHVDAAESTRVFAAAQDQARKSTQALRDVQLEQARAANAISANQSVSQLALAAPTARTPVNAASERLATATLHEAEAQRTLRDVQQQVALSTLSEEEKAQALSVALERAKAASLELSTAQKDLGEAEAVAAREAELSSNIFIRSMQRMAIGAEESMGQVRERVFAAAGSLKLSEGFSFGSLGGLGELLGIGIAADMAGEFLNKTADVNVELGHLAEKTGIAVDKLSGLQLIVKEMHGDFDAVSTALVRMQNAQVLANQGHKEQAQGFHDIGISVEELRGLNAEGLLQRIAMAFDSNGNHAAQAAAAIAIFGRGGQALIPILREQGGSLQENIDRASKMTHVTEGSVAASERWARNMADLTAKFHAFGNLLIEYVMPIVVGTLDGIGAVFQTLLEPIAAAIVVTTQAVIGLAKLAADAAKGNWSALADDARATSTSIKATWATTFKDIHDAWKSTETQFHPDRSESGHGAPDAGLPDALPKGGGANKADQDRLRSFEQALNEEKLLHSVSIQEEYSFWQDKIGAFTKGSTQYGTVLNRLAELATEGARKFHEAIQKLKEKPGKDSAADADFGKEFEHISAEMHGWLVKTEEDLTRTGERWRGYWRAVAEGRQQAASADAALEEQALTAKHAAGELTDLQYAQQLAVIHSTQLKAEIKALTDELEQLQAVAAKSPHDALTGQLLDPRLAEQIKQLENQIAQLQAKMKQQGFGDSGAIKNEISKPFLSAFQAIEQGWQKVQRDMILGTGNIKKDFVQMGAELVVQLAQNLEKMLAQWAAYEIRTVIAHKLANAIKTGDDATSAALSNAINANSALKDIYKDAKVAAAHAYKAVVGIPIVGPVLGPIAAGVAFAGVMSLAAFEHGGIVDGPVQRAVPIMAHGGERVLTAGQTQNFERLVNNSSSSSSSRTNNVRVNQKQTFNGGKASSAAATQATIRKLHRNGKLSLA